MLCKGDNTADINDIFWWGSEFGLILQVLEAQGGYFTFLNCTH